MTRPVKVSQVAVAPLPDGRLQLWAVGDAGQLFSTWNTRNPNVPWEAWENFLTEEIRLPANVKVSQVGVAPLPDKRLQLWAVGDAGQLFSTRKATSDPDAPWVPWKNFLTDPPVDP